MSLLKLRKDGEAYWLQISPAKGPEAMINLGGWPGAKPTLSRQAIEAALKEQELSMPTKKVYYAGTSPHSFRPGQRAEILGVFYVTPPGCQPRACFALRYADGVQDFSPIHDADNYELSDQP